MLLFYDIFIRNTHTHTLMYDKFTKRLLDIALSAAGIAALSPVLLLVTAALLFANRGKAFFMQPRPGRNGRIFRVVKFKTMNDRRGESGELLPPAERITRAGAIVRKTSLDEIPQLFNVLAGSMSLVGPRPLRIEYLPLYDDRQRRRHDVRPGITGWAQVNGRNALSWEDKFELDIHYVDNISFGLDLKIIAMTIKKTLRREDVYQGSGEQTARPFKGIKLDS